MSFWEILLIAIGLSMDAFAVSVGKGLSARADGGGTASHAVCAALWFGGFQALMPLIGWLLASAFAGKVESIDHWVAFGLLVAIGINMIRECFSDDEKPHTASFGAGTMFLLAVATSIDALAAGISLAMLDTSIWIDITVIGLTTALFSAVGILAGDVIGKRFHKGAQILGGVILIGIGLKILLEHLLA